MYRINDKNKYKYKKYTHKKENKTNKTKKKFVKLNCSPTNKNKQRPYTCYDDEDLIKLKDVWNSRHSDAKIESKDPKVIWDMLKIYYSKTCDRESCWIKDLVRGTRLEKELMDSFAPQSPSEWKKNPNEWLSSVDILEVMGQYEKKYIDERHERNPENTRNKWNV